MSLRIITVFSLLFSSATWASSIDFNLNNDSLRVNYASPIGKTKGLQMEMGWLHFDPRDVDILDLGLHVSGENWSKSGTFNIRLGVRTAFVSAGATDILALAPGVNVRFSPAQRVGIGGHFYYSPDIVTWLDGERYTEWGVRLDYQLLAQAYVYLGYRDIEVGINGTTVGIEDTGHVGMKIHF